MCLLVAMGIFSTGGSFAQHNNKVAAELLCDGKTIEPGSTFRLGVKFTIPPHAHIYWRNPGDSGLATGIEWDLPNGFSVGELQWPNPTRFEIREIDDISHGYADEVLLFAEVTAPAQLPSGESIALTADPYWLVCLESGQCIPESITLKLEIPIREKGTASASELFAKYAARVPVALDDESPITLERGPGARLKIVAKSPWRFQTDKDSEPLEFFPNEEAAWKFSHLTRDRKREAVVLFLPTRERDTMPGGVLTLPMRNESSGKIRRFYFEVTE